MRFYVTELEGFYTARTGRHTTPPGISCQVIDRAYNHRLIATYRSENYKQRRGEAARNRVRQLAADHAARLNGLEVAA